MLSEIVAARELIWILFSRDFRARYRQSLLGVLWAVLEPLFAVGAFVFMNRSGIFVVADVGVPYALYALTGLTLWHIFSSGVAACSVALIEASQMISKINLPREALIFAAFGRGAAEFMIRLMLTAVAFVWYGVSPGFASLILGAASLLPLCLLTVGIGFFVAMVAAIFRDVVNATALVLSGILVLSPILYPLPKESLLTAANAFNPFNYLINVPRDLILHGSSTEMSSYFFAALFSSLVFVAGWRLFHVAQPHIAERI
jgi:lipopolysaccharide transport system permease protein